MLPERRPRTGPAARQEQRAPRGFAEARREHRRSAQLRHDQTLDVVGIGDEQRRVERRVPLGHAHDESVVGPHHLRVETPFMAQHRGDRHRPRRVHAAAEGREHRQAPVAEVVGGALDQDRAIVGHHANRALLVVEVVQQVLGRARREAMVVGQARARLGRRGLAQLAREPANGLAEFDGTARTLTLPERHLAGLAGRRRHDHAVVRDLLDAPRGRAEQERLARSGLEHHLFVEFADPRAPGRVGAAAGEEHAVQAAIGNRASVADSHALGAVARGNRAVHAVPGDARSQLREFVGGIAA